MSNKLSLTKENKRYCRVLITEMIASNIQDMPLEVSFNTGKKLAKSILLLFPYFYFLLENYKEEGEENYNYVNNKVKNVICTFCKNYPAKAKNEKYEYKYEYKDFIEFTDRLSKDRELIVEVINSIQG